MKRIRLQIWSQDRKEKVAEFVWEDGKTTIVTCAFENDAKKWIEHGLDEWIGPPEDPTSRHTDSSAQILLERIGSYIKRQSGFNVSLSEFEEIE